MHSVLKSYEGVGTVAKERKSKQNKTWGNQVTCNSVDFSEQGPNLLLFESVRMKLKKQWRQQDIGDVWKVEGLFSQKSYKH